MTRICELVQPSGALAADEAMELMHRATREFEEHRTVWPMAIA